MSWKRSPVTWFLVFTYVLTIVGQALNIYTMGRLSEGVAGGTPIEDSPVWTWKPYGFLITNGGPSLVGLIMTFALYRVPGVQRMAIQMSPWSLGPAWPVLAASLWIPLLCVLGPYALLSTSGLSEPVDSWQLSTYLYGAFLGGGFFGPGLCEELGWRGFALPHLQQRYSALTSSLILGGAWAIWHWPNYFISSLHTNPFGAFAMALPMGMTAAILYTWVYNSTRGSLFAVIVLHGATVSTPGLPPSAGSASVLIPALYTMIAVGLVWRFGGANLSWREKVVAYLPDERQTGQALASGATHT